MSSAAQLLDDFCAAMAARDRSAILGLFDDHAQLVTSEQSVLFGRHELVTFVDRYLAGPTTYSWIWERRESGGHDDVGWVTAIGVETATTGAESVGTPYRMTIVATGGRILVLHGSSPHTGPSAGWA